MATQNRKPHDRKQIDVNNPSELLLHSQRLNRPPPVVVHAVGQVGPDVDAVAAFLDV